MTQEHKENLIDTLVLVGDKTISNYNGKALSANVAFDAFFCLEKYKIYYMYQFIMQSVEFK